jgi:WD40 repeat protein
VEALLTSPVDERVNPYVGPRWFTEDDETRFFGRDREAAEMLSLVVAHRAVLLFAQSGAGKSSLLRARLIPTLRRRGFDVLPIGRLKRTDAASVGTSTNVFTHNTIASWGATGATTLREALEHLPVTLDARGNPSPRIVVFDQFEELFSAYPERFDERATFLRELTDVLEDDAIARAVFAIREDYLASLTSLDDLFPEELRTRYRLQRLRRDAALLAITRPLQSAGVWFEPGVAEELVDDLLRRPQGVVEFVEPVQLQVACFTLFEQLPTGAGVITRDHLRSFGNVDEALKNYYAESLQRAVRTSGVPESRLREWFDTKLIIEGRARGMSFRGATHTDGVPNVAVDALAQQHLIVGEARADGSVWYELSHDRFIEPIHKANERWRERAATRRTMRRWVLAGGGVAVGLLMALLVMLLLQTRKVVTAQKLAMDAKQLQIVARDRETAEARRAADAAAQREAAQHELVIAQQQVASATAHARQLEARELAEQRELETALAGSHVATRPDLAALISLEALHENTGNVEARASLLGALENSPQLQMYLRDHDRPVVRALFSPNGKAIISAGEDGTIVIWSADSGRPAARPIRTGQKLLEDVAISPDGRLLASADGDASVRLWDIPTGSQHGPPLNDSRWTGTVAFSPDGSYVAAGGGDNSVRVWNIARPGDAPLLLVGHTKPVISVAFSPDGRTLASAGFDGSVRVWDWHARRETLPPLTGHVGSVWAVTFSPDGTLASSGSDRTIRLWDVSTGALRRRPIVAHGDSVTAIAFNSDGSVLVSASADRLVRLWNAADGTPIGEPLVGHANPVRTVAFSPDGRRLVSGDYGNDVIVWDLESHHRLGAPRFGHLTPVWAVACSPDGRIVATGGGDKRIVLWDRITRARLGPTLEGHTADVAGLAFSPDGSLLASASSDATVRLWDVVTGRPSGEPLTGHRGVVFSVAFDPSGSRLASAGADGSVKLWNLTNRALVREFTGLEADARAVVFSPDGRLVAAGGGGGVIHIWNVASGQQQPPLTGHDNTIRALVFASNEVLLSTGIDKRVLAWDLGTPSPRPRDLAGVDDDVYSLAVSPDGRTAFAGESDGTIHQLDVAGRKLARQPLNGHGGAIYALAMTRSGVLLASNANGEALAWNTATGQLLGESMMAHSKEVFSVAFHPKQKLLVSGGSNDVTVWNLDVARSVNMESVTTTLNQVVFSPDGKTVAGAGCGNWDKDKCTTGAIQFWNPEDGSQARETVTTGPGNVTSIAFVDGDAIVAGNSAGGISVWNTKSRRRVAAVPDAHDEEIGTLAVSPNGRYFVSGGDDGAVKLWRLDKTGIGSPVEIVKGVDPSSKPNQEILRVAFSPDGRLVATGSRNRAIVLWDVASPQRPRELRRLLGHTGSVDALAFTPDGRTLVSGSIDKTVRLWDVESGKPIGTMHGHSADIESIAVSADGSTAVSGARDGLLFIWDLDVASWRSRVCEMVGRNLEKAEWAQYLPGHVPSRTCPQVTARQADSAALNGDRPKAARLFAEAVTAAIQQRERVLMNQVCWFGSLDGFEAVVWPACEAAMQSASDDVVGMFADSRGLARALRGDRSGAIKDFSTFLEWSRKHGFEGDASVPRRRQWIDELKQNRNPFTQEVLIQLRSETMDPE